MDPTKLAVVAEIGKRLCVLSLFVFTCKVPGLIDSSRLSTRVIIRIRIRAETRRRLTHVQTHPVVFDFYVLAVDLRLLLDPWRRGPVPLHSLTEVSVVLTVAQINYAWPGSKSWSKFISTSPRYLIIFTFTQQCLCCSLLYGIPKKTSSCDGLDSIVEQVHSNVADHLQGHHVFSLHKVCKFRSAMLPRRHADEASYSCEFPPILRSIYPHRRSLPLSTTQ